MESSRNKRGRGVWLTRTGQRGHTSFDSEICISEANLLKIAFEAIQVSGISGLSGQWYQWQWSVGVVSIYQYLT